MIFGKYINKYYFRYFLFFFIGLTALVTVDYVQLLIPEITGNIIDFLKEGTLTTEQLNTYIIQIALYAVIIVFGRFCWRYFIFGTSRRIEHDIREDMFKHALKLDQSFYSDHKVGGLMAYFTNDLEMVRAAFGQGFLMIVDATFLGILAFYKMLQLDTQLALMSLIPMILIASYGIIVGKIIRPRYRKVQETYERMSDFTQENFSGIAVVKAFVKQTLEVKQFAEINQDFKEKNITFVKLSSAMHVVINATITLMNIFILGYGSYLVITTRALPAETQFTIGDLNKYIAYFNSLVWPLMAIGRFITMRSQATASLTRVNAFFNSSVDVKDENVDESITSISGNIDFNHLTFTYPKDHHPALKDVTLSIKQGEMVGIIGRTGCGKTTLVDLLLRVYNVQPSSLLLDGKDIMKIPLKVVRSDIAIVPQDTYLFSKTVKENIAFAFKEDTVDQETIEEYAKLADIHENVMEFPNQYETILGERGVTVSGGQKQRIAIARAMMKESRILILDDSVSAVDFKTEEKIIRNLKNIRQNKTTLIIAHRISTIKDLDKIVLMDEGRIVAVGTHHELLASSELYQDMVERQRLEDEMKEGTEDEKFLG